MNLSKVNFIAFELNAVPSWKKTFFLKFIVIWSLSFEIIGIPDANSGINSPLEFNSYNVSPRELINWIALRVLALAGSKDSIFPELATMIFLDILFEPQEVCKKEIKIINNDKKNFFS